MHTRLIARGFSQQPALCAINEVKKSNSIYQSAIFSFLQKESPWDVELHLAAARGDAKRLRVLLDSGRVHVDCKDKVGTSHYHSLISRDKMQEVYREIFLKIIVIYHEIYLKIFVTSRKRSELSKRQTTSSRK